MTTLPTTDSERISLGLASVIMTVFSAFGAFYVFSADLPQFGWLFTAIVIVTEHLFISTTLVFVLLLIWAIAMPGWVDRLFGFAWKKLYFMIGIAVIPIIILLVLAACGLKLGAGLDP